MPDYRFMEQQLSDPLSLQRRPVAVARRETPPAGVPRFTGTEPSGCSFWRIAEGGRTFYTVPRLYVAVPGKDLPRIAAELPIIAAANAKLSDYHRGRRQALATE